MALVTKVEKKISELLKFGKLISDDRKELLESFTNYISNKTSEGKEINLLFICTHNSRRSTMSQIWAQAAAEHFGILNVKCYSGGTEATAFNPRAVRAVEEAGFEVEQKDESENPLYLVTYAENKEPIKCFSKVYSDPFNPQKKFAAIMTCSDADANCLVVLGAEIRFPIRYDDPKEYDGTEIEEIKYKERFEQIGSEMLYAFKNAALHDHLD